MGFGRVDEKNIMNTHSWILNDQSCPSNSPKLAKKSRRRSMWCFCIRISFNSKAYIKPRAKKKNCDMQKVLVFCYQIRVMLGLWNGLVHGTSARACTLLWVIHKYKWVDLIPTISRVVVHLRVFATIISIITHVIFVCTHRDKRSSYTCQEYKCQYMICIRQYYNRYKLCTAQYVNFELQLDV